MALDVLQIGLIVVGLTLVLSIVLAVASLAIIKQINSPYDDYSDGSEAGPKVIPRFASRLTNDELRNGHSSDLPHRLRGSALELNGPPATQPPQLTNSSSLSHVMSLCGKNEVHTATAESTSSPENATITSGVVVCIQGSDDDDKSLKASNSEGNAQQETASQVDVRKNY